MPDHVANRKIEKRALEYLAEAAPEFYLPNSSEKDRVIELLGISPRFKQTFDAIRLLVKRFEDIKSARDFDLIEVKATAKHLPNLPHGFFFGLTENEEMLLKVFEGKYFLCFISLHEKQPGYALVSWTELQKLFHNKRIQYQINLRAKAKSATAGGG